MLYNRGDTDSFKWGLSRGIKHGVKEKAISSCCLWEEVGDSRVCYIRSDSGAILVCFDAGCARDSFSKLADFVKDKIL